MEILRRTEDGWLIREDDDKETFLPNAAVEYFLAIKRQAKTETEFKTFCLKIAIPLIALYAPWWIAWRLGWIVLGVPTP